jgi:hypothetical protein
MGAIMNAHDKSSSTRFLLGNEVSICSNGSYFAAHILARKHTTHINRDLPAHVDTLMRKIQSLILSQRRTIELLKSTPITSAPSLHDFLVKCMDRSIISAAQLGKVLHEYRSPQYPDFAPRNAWSLVNAFTTVFNQTTSFNPFALSERTPKLYTDVLAHFHDSPEAPSEDGADAIPLSTSVGSSTWQSGSEGFNQS